MGSMFSDVRWRNSLPAHFLRWRVQRNPGQSGRPFVPRPQAALPGAVQHRRLSGVGLWGVVGGEHLIYFLCFSEGAPRPEIGKKIISCPQCSVSCGEGQQTRRVLCRDARGDSSTKCEPDRKPPSTQPCRTGIDCPKEKHELDDELKEGMKLILPKFLHLLNIQIPFEIGRL